MLDSVSPAFLRHLTLKIKPCLFLPNEYIVHEGDIGYGIFFIYHGTVKYYSFGILLMLIL